MRQLTVKRCSWLQTTSSDDVCTVFQLLTNTANTSTAELSTMTLLYHTNQITLLHRASFKWWWQMMMLWQLMKWCMNCIIIILKDGVNKIAIGKQGKWILLWQLINLFASQQVLVLCIHSVQNISFVPSAGLSVSYTNIFTVH